MLHGFEALIDRDDEPTRALLDRLDTAEREAALRAEVEALKADLSTYMQAANEHLADAEALRKLQAGEAYKAADYLRACADAKPVAWTARHTSVTRFALWLFINNALARSERAAQKGSYEPVENVAKYQDDAKTAEEARAMLAAAPAAPQAEQPIDLDAVAMQQMRQAAAESTWMPAEYSGSDWISDVCRWLRDGPPQAEPKREPLSEPLSEEQMRAVLIAEARWIAAQAGEKDPDSLAVDEEMLAQVMLAGRAVERAHGIGGSDD